MPNVSIPSPNSKEEISCRFKAMKTYSKNLLKRLPEIGFSPDDFPLLAKRLSEKPSTRSYFIYKISEYISFQSNFPRLPASLIQNLGLLSEIIITTLYRQNHREDIKYGMSGSKGAGKYDKQGRNIDNFIENEKAIERLRKALITFINTHFPSHFQEEIHKCTNQIFHFTKLGFRLDSENLGYADLQKEAPNLDINEKDRRFVGVEEFLTIYQNQSKTRFKGISHMAYFENYLTRCFLLNGALFELFTNLLLFLYNQYKEDYVDLISYARCYGLLMQVVNDNSDFVPSSFELSTACKFAEDTYSDLRLGKITLPLIYFFNQDTIEIRELRNFLIEPSEEDRSTFIKKCKNSEFQYHMTLSLLESKSISKAQSLGAAFAEHSEKFYLNIDNPASEGLGDMLNIARGNRFYKVYNELKKEQRLLKKMKG